MDLRPCPAKTGAPVPGQDGCARDREAAMRLVERPMTDEVARRLYEIGGQPDRAFVHENAMVCTVKFNWRERLGFRLFPSRYCDTPGDPSFHWADCIVVKTRIELSWLDRLRVLFSGRINVETKVATQHSVGSTIANSESYPAPPQFLDSRHR